METPSRIQQKHGCAAKKSKTMSDVPVVSRAVGAMNKKYGDQEAHWLVTSFSSEMQDSGRFIPMMAWKDFETMGRAFKDSLLTARAMLLCQGGMPPQTLMNLTSGR